jgi:hypothetical protein
LMQDCRVREKERKKGRRVRGGIQASLEGEWDGPNVMHECMTDDGKRRHGQFF